MASTTRTRVGVLIGIAAGIAIYLAIQGTPLDPPLPVPLAFVAILLTDQHPRVQRLTPAAALAIPAVAWWLSVSINTGAAAFVATVLLIALALIRKLR